MAQEILETDEKRRRKVHRLRLAHDGDDGDRASSLLQRGDGHVSIRRDIKVSRSPTIDHVKRGCILNGPIVFVQALCLDDLLSGQFVSPASFVAKNKAKTGNADDQRGSVAKENRQAYVARVMSKLVLAEFDPDTKTLTLREPLEGVATSEELRVLLPAGHGSVPASECKPWMKFHGILKGPAGDELAAIMEEMFPTEK